MNKKEGDFILSIENLARELSYLDDEELVLRASAKAVCWVSENILHPEYEDTDKARNLAEALARYYYYELTVSAEESVKIGDLTVHTDNKKMLEIETHFRTEAICECSDILKDGDFYFEAS